MANTMKLQHDADVTGQIRVWSVNLRFGDFIRIDGHSVADSTRNTWYKVTENDDFAVSMVSEGGQPFTWTHDRLRAGGGYKIYLHPYSQKHNR